MTSEKFNTLTEFNKQYDIVRSDILKRHGYKKGDKVRLKNAIMLYQNFNGQWVRMTSVKVNMRDRIRTNTIAGNNAEYKLKARV